MSNHDRRLGAFPAIAGILLVFLLVVSPPPAAGGSGPLDGQRFAGETGEMGQEKGDPEEFVFQNGEFDPLACHQYGFSAAPYEARAAADGVHFTAETVSAKEGRMKWSGTVLGDRIEGTVVWEKEGQAPIEYWFKGSLAAD